MITTKQRAYLRGLANKVPALYQVGKGGVVRDSGVHKEVIEKVLGLARENGFGILGLTYSPIKGPEGNIEYLVYIEKDDNPKKEESVDLHAVVEAAHGSLDK